MASLSVSFEPSLVIYLLEPTLAQKGDAWPGPYPVARLTSAINNFDWTCCASHT
jgi:hypothetical protein